MIPAPDSAARTGKKKPTAFGRTSTLNGCGLIAHTPLLQAGLTIAADSCSLIFLNTLHLLDVYVCVHSVVITQALFDELTRKPFTANIAEDPALYGKILEKRIVSIPHAAAPAQPHGALSAADCSLLHAYEGLKPDGILTDDRGLCRYCRQHTIPYINTPMAVFALLYNGHLSHEQYTVSLQTLYGIGRYGQFVREHMEKLYTAYCAAEN